MSPSYRITLVSTFGSGTSDDIHVAPGQTVREVLRSRGMSTENISVRRNNEEITLDTAVGEGDTVIVGPRNVKAA